MDSLGCLIFVLSGRFSSPTFKLQFKALAEDSIAKHILSEQCKNVCHSFPGTHYSGKKFPLYFLSFLVGGGNKSETIVAGNLKDELSIWVGLFGASNSLRDICAQPYLNLSENGQRKLPSYFFYSRIKSRSSKFGNKAWAR